MRGGGGRGRRPSWGVVGSRSVQGVYPNSFIRHIYLYSLPIIIKCIAHYFCTYQSSMYIKILTFERMLACLLSVLDSETWQESDLFIVTKTTVTLGRLYLNSKKFTEDRGI